MKMYLVLFMLAVISGVVFAETVAVTQPAISGFNRVTLTDGRILEGNVNDEGDHVLIKMDLGTMEVRKSEIKKIEPFTMPAVATPATTQTPKPKATAETIAEKQARLEKLKAEVAALENELATQTASDESGGAKEEKNPAALGWNRDYYVLKEQLQKKWDELESKASNETAAQRTARFKQFHDWAKANYIGKPVDWNGEIDEVGIDNIGTSGYSQKTPVYVDFVAKDAAGKGGTTYSRIACSVPPNDAAKIARGSTCVMSTKIQDIQPRGSEEGVGFSVRIDTTVNINISTK